MYAVRTYTFVQVNLETRVITSSPSPFLKHTQEAWYKIGNCKLDQENQITLYSHATKFNTSKCSLNLKLEFKSIAPNLVRQRCSRGGI